MVKHSNCCSNPCVERLVIMIRHSMSVPGGTTWWTSRDSVTRRFAGLIDCLENSSCSVCSSPLSTAKACAGEGRRGRHSAYTEACRLALPVASGLAGDRADRYRSPGAGAFDPEPEARPESRAEAAHRDVKKVIGGADDAADGERLRGD